MEKHNNNESAPDADGYADTLTDNSYGSSSGSDSDESNTSLLERNSILFNKFMLPKDLCENDAIFHEFFSPSLWDALAPSARQHLIKFLPISSDERPLASKVVHDLFSHRLDRFGTDQMTVFQHNLAKGNFRTDMAKLRCNLGRSLRKERRMLELQRMARLAKNLVLSRETTLLTELQTNGVNSMPPVFQSRYVHSGYRTRWPRQCYGSPELEKCRMHAKKRYLSEIVSVSEAAGIPLSVSDEEDCLDAIPSGPARKQRRMFGAGQHFAGDHALHGYSGVQGSSGSKRGALHGNIGGIGTNVFDGSTFVTPKLFVVTEEHYQRLLLQYRKRKFEEPDHPELNLIGVKLKDVVSRTQIAAGYRRILPLPKVYLPEVKIESTREGSEKSRSLKSIKANRMSCDQDYLKSDVQLDTPVANLADVAKAEPADDYGMVVPKVELMSSSTFDQQDSQADVKPLTSLICKKEEMDITVTTAKTAPDVIGSSFADQSGEKNPLSGTKIIHQTPLGGIDEDSGAVSVDVLIGSDTHACFLSLVRDLFCSNPDHRSTMEELQLRLHAWSSNPVAARNSWYSYQGSGDWNLTLQSAVQFLTGDFRHQPEDFVPYIEHKVALNILQWIGASRDGDSRLVPLCAYWQSRKQEMGLISTHTQTASNATNAHVLSLEPSCNNAGSTAGITSTAGVTAYQAKGKNKNSVNSKLLLLSSNSSSSSSSSLSSISSMTTIGDGSSMLAEVPAASMSLGAVCSSQDDDGSVSERSVSPPPPRFPTDWAVRKATEDEVRSFREQEKRRYENPHMAFTYKQHSYDSVVGPVKGIYTQVPGISKARGHSMLVADRPNFVTILTLVRDATARLPNGEGTRADICELLKSSQYISPTATDQILQTIVSGALDRMHTEHDPCVKYDAKRKIWIYLHRNRTEEEFERLHLQYQGFTKHKKTVTRKPVKCHKENASSTTRMVSNIGLAEGGVPPDTSSSANLSHEQDSSDMSISATNILDTSSATSSPAANSVSIVSSPVTSYSVKPATSLLKKQSTSVLSHPSQVTSFDRKADETVYSGIASTRKTVAGQPEQSKQSLLTLQQQSLLASVDTATDSKLKMAPKASGAVTIITSTGSSVKTIKIPKSSLSLASKPANIFGTTSTATGAAVHMDNSTPVEGVLPSYITLPQKNVLVSTLVSSAKSTAESSTIVSTVGCSNTKLLADVLRKVPSMPIVVQSSSSTDPLQSSSTLVSSPIEGDKKVQPGGSILSIRQVNSSPGTIVASAASPSLVNEQSSQMILHTKALKLPLNNVTVVSSAGTGNVMHPGVKVSTTMVGVVAPSAKPIFTTSTSSSLIKSHSASANIQSHSSPSTVVATASSSALPQRVVVSTATAYTPVNSVGSAGVTVKPAGIVTSISGSPSTATIIPNSTTHRVIRPSTNLISTITLAKGQQSVLTPAQQKQILQNLLCQQQKQQVLTAKKILPAMIATSVASTVDHPAGESRPGETGNQTATASLLQDNQRPAGTVSTFKLQHHPSTNQTIRALSPQIVKITPAPRACGPPTASISGSTATMVSAVSPMSAQVPAGMKMMKVHQSSILTSTGTHTMLPAGTISSSNMVAVSGAPGSTATMRVVKTATGTTTVIKTGVHGAAQSAQLLPQTPTMHHATIAKLRKDGTTPIVSKVTVTPNVSTGQLIPLESLLQKQGITATSTNSPGGPMGSTFLKIAGTGKVGQPQFLQFSTNTTNVTGGTQAHVSPITAVSSGGHQYTVVAQNARNIISVTPSTAGTVGRSANMPVTIVTSIAQGAAANDGLKSAAMTHVSSSIGTESNVSTASGATILSHAAAAGKLQHANKIKLFASTGGVNNPTAVATVNSIQQQQGTVINPKTPMAATVLGGTSGDFLTNAKIIGVRNVTAAKIKAGSSLSIMNAGNLNIAHIGGKPIIIANSSALSANPSVTVSTANNNQGNSSAGSNSTMALTSNASYNNVLQIDPSAKGKNVLAASSATGGDGGVGGGVIQPGHTQTQTLMLGNQMVKVQTIQAAGAAKLAHQKRHTILPDGTAAPRETSSAVHNAILTTAPGCTIVQQQQQPQQTPICSVGNTASSSSNVPKSITVNSAIAAGALAKSIVKIQPGSTAPNNTAAKVIEMGQPKTQAQQTQRVVLATSSGQLLSQPIILPSGFQSSGPINIKRLKVIPVSKQCKK